MKKIGIITIYDNNNYGNRLQNYALQETLKELGCEPVTIRNNAILNKKTGNPVEYLLRIVKYCFVTNRKTANRQRKQCFDNFGKNIETSKKVFNWYSKSWLKQFDFFITGSDQVWNPKYRLSKFDLLAFANNSQRISYAASIANDSIPDSSMLTIAEEVKDYKAISVREESAKNIVEKATGRNDVEVLLDPTMLVEKERWISLIKRPRQLNYKKYIVCYFLGQGNEILENEIQRIAKENNCEIINLLNKDGEFYQTGPSEFLYLISNAFLVITDSFHACVFSILFETPFIVCDRKINNIKTMGARIDTLLSKFKMNNRKFDNTIKEDMLKIDCSYAYEVLNTEKEKSISFLKRALDE